MEKRQYNFKDLTGQKFGRLTIISFAGLDSSQKSIWKCLCDCGTIKCIGNSALKKGTTKSCGCYRKERSRDANRKPPGESGFQNLFRRYKTVGRKRKIEFSLTESEFRYLVTQLCYYCDGIPKNIIKSNSHKHNKEGLEYSKFIYNGIDRVDNSKGYIKENCVTCCQSCNFNKKDVSSNIIIKSYIFLLGITNG